MFTEQFADLKNWNLYSGRGNDNKGARSSRQVAVNRGILTITGTPSGTTGGLSLNHHDQQYGQWSVRMRAPVATGVYHPVALLWGVAGSNPAGVNDAFGEIDIVEFWQDGTRRTNGTTLHYGDGSEMVEQNTRVVGADWNVYNLLWTPTYMYAWINDEAAYFVSTEDELFPQNPVQFCLQLDWFPDEVDPHDRTMTKTGASMEVDWVQIKTLAEIPKTK